MVEVQLKKATKLKKPTLTVSFIPIACVCAYSCATQLFFASNVSRYAGVRPVSSRTPPKPTSLSLRGPLRWFSQKLRYVSHSVSRKEKVSARAAWREVVRLEHHHPSVSFRSAGWGEAVKVRTTVLNTNIGINETTLCFGTQCPSRRRGETLRSRRL